MSERSLTLPVLLVPDGVPLPGMVLTLGLHADDARAAVEAAQAGDGRVLLVPQVTGRSARLGVVAHVEQSGTLPDGQPVAILRAGPRATVGAGVSGSDAALRVEASIIADPAPSVAQRERTRDLRGVLNVLAERRRSRRLPEILRNVAAPGELADAVAAWGELPPSQAVEVLDAVDVGERINLVLAWARETLATMEVADQIRSDVAEGMERTQREYLLRQQLEAIRKELRALGAADGDGDDPADDYRTRVAAMPLPDAVRATVEREIDRLERTSAQSPEQSWIRTWLDRILELPWAVRSDDRLDLTEARAVLDADHTGLDEVKDRIIEHLAVRKLRNERDDRSNEAGGTNDAERGAVASARRGGGAIIALVGPPGVGKTSLGESVARAMGRAFVRVALGGVRDEAEIRGHRRTYVGAQPGRIARAIAEAGTMNPVILLDEVDKVGSDWRGDPSSALLEVLDPAQNHTFRDHYLEVDLDLSAVLFLATANVAEAIPGPLYDRMEVVRLDGYTEHEKVGIGRDHLLARLIDRVGLRPDEIAVDDAAIRLVVTDYTREAGVRSLERELGRLVRKVATRVAGGETTPIGIGANDVAALLGRPRFFADEVADRTAVAGVATGLAVTGTGGDVLFVEASASDGEAGLTLTGQLGDVMKESAQIALSYVRARAGQLGLDRAALDRRFHVHVPAGAVPKDGPSAGVTLTTALVSLLTGRAVRATVGMTGEVTLQGRVLPIGGVKQKVLAAHRAGLREVVLPSRNGPDLEDVPPLVREQMTFHLVDDVRDVLAVALEPPAAALSSDLAAA